VGLQRKSSLRRRKKLWRRRTEVLPSRGIYVGAEDLFCSILRWKEFGWLLRENQTAELGRCGGECAFEGLLKKIAC
jgi:hypothetical protein